MKKRGFIAGALALCLTLGGTGYAYWTDALHITTTATTGNLDVEFVDLGYLAQWTEKDENAGWSLYDGTTVVNAYELINKNVNSVGNLPSINNKRGDRAYSLNVVDSTLNYGDTKKLAHTVPNSSTYEAGMTDASKNIVFRVDNIYPGYAQAFRTDIVNDGDLAAKLTDISSTIQGVSDLETGNLKDMIGIALFVDNENVSTPILKLAASGCFKQEDIFTIGGVDFVRLSAVERATKATEANEKLATYLKDTRLVISHKEGARFDAFVGIGMDPDAVGTYTSGNVDLLKASGDSAAQDQLIAKDSDSENKGITITIDFLWAQYNNPGNQNATPNVLDNQNAVGVR